MDKSIMVLKLKPHAEIGMILKIKPEKPVLVRFFFSCCTVEFAVNHSETSAYKSLT